MSTFCRRCDLHVIDSQRLRDELSALREAYAALREAYAPLAPPSDDAREVQDLLLEAMTRRQK